MIKDETLWDISLSVEKKKENRDIYERLTIQNSYNRQNNRLKPDIARKIANTRLTVDLYEQKFVF